MLIRHSLLKSEQSVLLVKLLYPKRDTEALPTGYSVTIISVLVIQLKTTKITQKVMNKFIIFLSYAQN